ncbi:MAG: adenylate kinase [Gemmiger sp.]
MKLILLGAPGAGKGTQAEILCDKLNIPTISTGNILRAAVKDGTPMGLEAKKFMDAGALVPDDVIVGIVKERLAAPDCANGFILDGMPRTIAQGEALEKMGVEIDKVLNIIVEDEAIMNRMAGRRVCAKCGASYHVKNKPSKVEGVCDRCGGELVIRKDDQPETVRERLVTYHEQTEPLVEFYRQRGKLVDIQDQGSIEKTNAYILKMLEA